MELRFKSTAGFRKYEAHFAAESVAHPAKANLLLLEWIIERYTKAGETVLDPMAGTGSTGIVASILGRNAVLVELEPKFVGFIEANLAKSRGQAIIGERGTVRVFQGDARNLSGLLADTIVTSPPYEECMGKKHHSPVADKIAAEKAIGMSYTGRADVVLTSPPYAEMNQDKRPFGGVGADMSRLWQSYQANGGGMTFETFCHYYRDKQFRYSGSKENLGNLPYGGPVDAILSSPPYANRLADAAVRDGDGARMSYRQAVDAILTSPPYQESLYHLRNKPPEFWEKLAVTTGRKAWVEEGGRTRSTQAAKDEGYSESQENIGNLKGATYLSQMLLVYRECHRVLREQGKMVLITKNFIRDKRVVRLDEDTVRLCEAAGFRLLERHRFKLPSQSFWRTLYAKKHPEVEAITHEDVLVFERA